MAIVACLLTILANVAGAGEPSAADIIDSFRDVPRECTQVPFWFWNGPLDPEQFRWQLREMADKGVYAAMPHPRFGMDRRQYLEEPFWRAMAATIDEAKKLGMEIWLYDEYNWPSGGAGGRVTDGHPELYPRGLDYRVYKFEGQARDISIEKQEPTQQSMERFEKIVRGFIKPKDAQIDAYESWGQVASDGSRISGALSDGPFEVIVFFQALGRNPSVLDIGSNSMTDYLSKESARRFISLTHEQYARRFGRDFGTTVPVIFTDEASTTSPAAFPWTERFAAEFRDRHGYDILDKLPLLLDGNSSEGAKVRLAYWQTVTNLFHTGFVATVTSWCKARGLKLTGHFYEEDIRSYAHSSQLMTLLGNLDMPGFDALGPRCPAHGAKVAISVAHLKDKEEAMCECLGLADGWNCTMDTLRTGYNVLGSLGVSRFVPHAFFQTLDNPRVECPPSFFYRNPYWKYYKKIADLSARLSYFNSLGKHVAPCAVYYPIESLWADSVGGKGQNVLPWQHRTEGNSDASETCKVFNDLADGLFAKRWDMDVVDERLLREGSVRLDGKVTKLCIGPEEFRVLIVPPVTAVGANTLLVIDRFLQKGGQVVWLGRLPRLTWPLNDSACHEILASWFGAKEPKPGAVCDVGEGRIAFVGSDIKAVLRYLDEQIGAEVSVSEGLDDLGVTHRRVGKADLFLLFNDSDEFVSGHVILGRDDDPVLVDMDTGKAYEGEVDTDGLKVDLRPRQSMCAIYGQAKKELPAWDCGRSRGMWIGLENWDIQLAGSELDEKWGCSVGPVEIELPVFRMKKREFTHIERWTEARFSDDRWEQIHVLRGNGLFEDASTILLRTQLPPGAKEIITPLPVTGEYALWVNGELLDKQLGPQSKEPGRIALGDLSAEESNILAIETYAHHNAAGLTGPVKVLCGPARIRHPKPWKDLGFGFYSGRVLYKTKRDLDFGYKRVWLRLNQVEHYVEAYVNGTLVDTLLWPPYEVEITDYVKRGTNEIALVVSNSIANRFAWDVWGTRGAGKAEPSGILGAVSLSIEQ